MKLSELNPDDVTIEEGTEKPLKLSNINPSELNEAEPEEQTGYVRSAKDVALGIGQGATLGFGDELLGAAEASSDVLSGDAKIQDWVQKYRQHQKEAEQGWEQAKERSPTLTAVGEIGGGMVTAAPLGLAKAGLSLGQVVGRGALAGAAAGLGGSKGTLEESPSELAKDVAFGGAFGGAGAGVFHQIGQGASKLSAMAKDSAMMNKVRSAFGMAKNEGQAFSGIEAGQQINRELDDTAGSITKQFLKPMEESSKMYNDALQEASDAGAKLGFNDNLVGALDSAKAKIFADSERGKGGITSELAALLKKHGSTYFDPETATQKTMALSPREAKDLQLGLRQLKDAKVFQEAGEIEALEKALTPAIRESLPPGQYDKINEIFKQARSISEPLINKGEIDPQFQSKWISDIDVDRLNPQLKTYITKLLKHSKDSNEIGVESKGILDDVLRNAKNINEKNQVNFIDPEQVRKQADAAGMKHTIRKGIYGERATETIGAPTGIMDVIKGSPYRVAEFAGKASRSTLANASRSLYKAPDDALRFAATKLNDSGMAHLGEALNQALDNKSIAAKNAVLFSIMQNPKSRKAVFGDETEE